MESKEEYHDPDYPGASAPSENDAQVLSEEEKIKKIKTIIRREFSNEIETRENEVMLIEQRMGMSRRILQRLRYALVNSYYNDLKLQLSKSHIEDDIAAQTDATTRAEVSTLLRTGQRRLHPSLRKLLGKQSADMTEIFKSREPRKKARKNYSAMLQTRNVTIPADATKSLRPSRPDEADTADMETADTEPGTSKPKKVPRHLEPKIENVFTLQDVTRNKMKHRYRIVIGNTSKYAPAASPLDRSTHKWLLYVRAWAGGSGPVQAVSARLHHSYAPHHVVTLNKPPFHISRRGWGEFPARVELHFPLPHVNRPAALDHTIKLDRHYTGLQTLGAETIVDVWLYSTPEMLEFEYVDPVPAALGLPDNTSAEPDKTSTEPEYTSAEPDNASAGPDNASASPYNQLDTIDIKSEPVEYDDHEQSESWMEFFNKDSTHLDVDEMIIIPDKNKIVAEKELEIEYDKDGMNEWPAYNNTDEPTDRLESNALNKRIMKYIDSSTGKIYYLEMDRKLDLSKVQEIVINDKKAKISPIKSNGLKNFRKKKGVSVLKTTVKEKLNIENQEKPKCFKHIANDHCYLGSDWLKEKHVSENSSEVKSVKTHLDKLCADVSRLTSVKMAVNYLLKYIPVITEYARDPDYLSEYPFAVDSAEKYWKLDFAKRRNIEWSRAKLINNMIREHLKTPDAIWRTKQILIYSRLHAFRPIRPEAQVVQTEQESSSWNELDNSKKVESDIKEIFPSESDINSLSVFNRLDISDTVETEETNVEVDIVGDVVEEKVVQSDSVDSLEVLPAEGEDSLRFMFVERMCADVGVELRVEDVGSGYAYSAVHAVLVSAMKSLISEIVRSAAAASSLREEADITTPAVWTGSRVRWVGGADVWEATRSGRLSVLSNRGLATTPGTSHAL